MEPSRVFGVNRHYVQQALLRNFRASERGVDVFSRGPRFRRVRMTGVFSGHLFYPDFLEERILRLEQKLNRASGGHTNFFAMLKRVPAGRLSSEAAGQAVLLVLSTLERVGPLQVFGNPQFSEAVGMLLSGESEGVVSGDFLDAAWGILTHSVEFRLRRLLDAMDVWSFWERRGVGAELVDAPGGKLLLPDAPVLAYREGILTSPEALRGKIVPGDTLVLPITPSRLLVVFWKKATHPADTRKALLRQLMGNGVFSVVVPPGSYTRPEVYALGQHLGENYGAGAPPVKPEGVPESLFSVLGDGAMAQKAAFPREWLGVHKKNRPKAAGF